MTDSEQQLDEWLATADQALHRPAKPVSGSAVREVARQRSAVMRQRLTVAAVGAALLVTAGIWSWTSRDATVPVVAEPKGEQPVDRQPADPTQLVAEVEQMQRESKLLRQEIRLLQAQRRLQRLQHELELTRRYTASARSVEQSNTTAWSILVRMSDWQPRLLTEQERIQLERLARSFPQTTAESVAREMLATNEVSQVLF